MKLSAKWTVSNPEKMVEVFRILMTEEFNQDNSFQLKNGTFECEIEMGETPPQKAIEAMTHLGKVLEFSYNYSKKNENTKSNAEPIKQIEPAETPSVNTQPESIKEPESNGAINLAEKPEIIGKTEVEKAPETSGKIETKKDSETADKIEAEKDSESNAEDKSEKESENGPEKPPEISDKTEPAETNDDSEVVKETETGKKAKTKKTNTPDECDEKLDQIAKQCQSYVQFVAKIEFELCELPMEYRKAATEMMNALPKIKKLTIIAIEEEAQKAIPITMYTSLKIGEAIKEKFGCTKMAFFKKVLTHYHDWDKPASDEPAGSDEQEKSKSEKTEEPHPTPEVTKEPEEPQPAPEVPEEPAKSENSLEPEKPESTEPATENEPVETQADETKQNDSETESSAASVTEIKEEEPSGRIFTSLAEPTAEKKEIAGKMEGLLRQVANRTDITLTQKVRDTIKVLVPTVPISTFQNIPEYTAEILKRDTIAYDERTPFEEKEVYLQWVYISKLTAEYYYGQKRDMVQIKAKDFLDDLKRLLVK